MAALHRTETRDVSTVTDLARAVLFEPGITLSFGVTMSLAHLFLARAIRTTAAYAAFVIVLCALVLPAVAFADEADPGQQPPWITTQEGVNQAPWVTLKAPSKADPDMWTALATDLEGDQDLQYYWDFGDGSFSREQAVVHRYSEPGVYTITLSVADSRGATTLASKTVLIHMGAVAARR